MCAAALDARADPPGGDAATLPFSITATKLRSDERGTYEAEWNVSLVQRSGPTLSADWVALNRVTRLGVAVGHVEIVNGSDVVRANFAVIDLDSMRALTISAPPEPTPAEAAEPDASALTPCGPAEDAAPAWPGLGLTAAVLSGPPFPLRAETQPCRARAPRHMDAER